MRSRAGPRLNDTLWQSQSYTELQKGKFTWHDDCGSLPPGPVMITEPNCCITTTCLCQTEVTEGSSVALSSVQTEVTWLQQMVWNIWTMCLSHQQNQPTSQSGENPWKWRSRWILAHRCSVSSEVDLVRERCGSQGAEMEGKALDLPTLHPSPVAMRLCVEMDWDLQAAECPRWGAASSSASKVCSCLRSCLCGSYPSNPC